MTSLSPFSVLTEHENFIKLSLFDYTRVMVRVAKKTVQNRYRQWCFPQCVANFWSPSVIEKEKNKERGEFQHEKIRSTAVSLTFFRPDAHSVRIRRRIVLALEH